MNQLTTHHQKTCIFKTSTRHEYTNIDKIVAVMKAIESTSNMEHLTGVCVGFKAFED
jgi:hypothetical protein